LQYQVFNEDWEQIAVVVKGKRSSVAERSVSFLVTSLV